MERDCPKDAEKCPEGELRDALRPAATGIELRRFRGVVQPFAAHFHDCYVFGVMRAGKRRLTCASGAFSLQAGDVMVLNPGDAHACVQEDGEPLAYDGIMASAAAVAKALSRAASPGLRPDCMSDPIAPAENAPHFVGPVVRGRAFDRACALADALAAGSSPCRIENLMALLAGSIPLRRGSGRPAGDGLEAAAAYLRAHAADRVSLDELSRIAGISRYGLVRAFASRYGITPHKYAQSVKVEQACALLADGRDPAAVATELGFSDQPHMTRLVKQRLGLTPAAYRDAVSKGAGACAGLGKRRERE